MNMDIIPLLDVMTKESNLYFKMVNLCFTNSKPILFDSRDENRNMFKIFSFHIKIRKYFCIV